MTHAFRSRLALWLGLVACGAIAGQAYSAVAYPDMAADLRGTWPGIRGGAMVASVSSGFEMFINRGRVVAWFRKRTFLAALVVRVVVHTALVVAAMIASRRLSAYLTARQPGSAFDLRDVVQDTIYALVIASIILFVMQMRTLIGGRTLLNVILGRYHRPVREMRLFLLVDLTGSTPLAESLGDERFHEYLSAFFFELDVAITNNGGEIHSYIGDALIASWLLREPKRNGRIFSAVIEARERIAERSAWFTETFGAAPTFRAILHGGPIVSGECGDSRRQITYLGDVLNVTGRLESLAKQLDVRNLASSWVVQRSELPATVNINELGTHDLKGVRDPIALTSWHVNAQA